MEYQKLKISEIEPLEARYCFRYSLEDAELAESIRGLGILTPLVVLPQGEGRWGLISGFKRFYAALKLKLSEIPAFILKDSLNEREIVRVAFEQNRNGRFSPLDQAVAVNKLIKVLGFSRDEVREEFLPYLGLAPSPKVFQEYEKISKLDQEILEALNQNLIPFRGISDLADFSGEDQRILWENFLSQFYFTSSELSEFIILVQDLIAMKNEPVQRLCENPDIQKVARSAGAGGQKPKAKLLIEHFKRLRYPRSHEIRKLFRDKIAHLKFKNPIQIFKSDFMEEEGIELKIRLLKRDSLGKVLEELSEKRRDIEEVTEL